MISFTSRFSSGVPFNVPRLFQNRISQDFGHFLSRCGEMTNKTPPGSMKEVLHTIYQLPAADMSLQTIQKLFEPWQDHTNPGSLQPAALDDLNDSFVMGVTIDNGWNDILRLLLSYGMRIENIDMSKAIHQAKQRHDFTALRMLFQSGWDINRPVNSHCPPALRHVRPIPH